MGTILVTGGAGFIGSCFVRQCLAERAVRLVTLDKLTDAGNLPVYGDGRNARDWLFVEDHCGALRRVLTAGVPGETYNIGGDCEQKNIDVVRTICEAVDAPRPGLAHAPCASLIRHVKDRSGHDRCYATDAGKIEPEPGWQSEHDFAAGIRHTVKWYLRNGSDG